MYNFLKRLAVKMRILFFPGGSLVVLLFNENVMEPDQSDEYIRGLTCGTGR